MIEVFKTSVTEERSEALLELLQRHFPESEINFDLDDCDKILRIKSDRIDIHFIVTLMNEQGFHCEVLE
jgi:hypothetical protein